MTDPTMESVRELIEKDGPPENLADKVKAELAKQPAPKPKDKK